VANVDADAVAVKIVVDAVDPVQLVVVLTAFTEQGGLGWSSLWVVQNRGCIEFKLASLAVAGIDAPGAGKLVRVEVEKLTMLSFVAAVSGSARESRNVVCVVGRGARQGGETRIEHAIPQKREAGRKAVRSTTCAPRIVRVLGAGDCSIQRTRAGTDRYEASRLSVMVVGYP
jgi:hypothetical protein